MTGGSLLRIGLSFVLYFLVQVFVLKDLVLFGDAFCFLYIYALLLLPLELRPVPVLLLGFFLGLAVDVFYDTTGMHALSTVLLAFLRKTWIKANIPRGGYEENVPPTLLNMGPAWFTSYALPLILVHHSTFFYADVAGTDNYESLLVRVLSSTFFTFILGIIIQVIFYQRKRFV